MLQRPVLLSFVFAATAFAAGVSGRVLDLQGQPVQGAAVQLAPAATTTGTDGQFHLDLDLRGPATLSVHAEGFTDIHQAVNCTGTDLKLELRFTGLAPQSDSVTVTGDASDARIEFPDPQRLYLRQETMDANPGRPGAPISIPGLPVETASGGIKAPQYFAPGVAGDHGEPIAQFFQVGDLLLPNNLSANAHGNGYADPNLVVAAGIESVQVDGGAFNVREGNHSVDFAAIYGFRQRLEPFVTVTGDGHDADLSAGWSPEDTGKRSWVALEAGFGDGYLRTPEGRRQYKLNGFRVFELGHHVITTFAAGYFGESRIPGLIPIQASPSLPDTIDPRQSDQTHTGEFAATDTWRPASNSQFTFSGFFRTYNLNLLSDFGDGLIRQSEFRTVAGGNASYIRKVNRHLTIMTGIDYLRDAPRRLDLDRYTPELQKVTSNNVTLDSLSPYASVDGGLTSWLHYNLGWRRDQIRFDNADLLNPANSFTRWVPVDSPKATLSVTPRRAWAPSASFSFGQSFFTNDPRIGLGTTPGSPVNRAHSFQMVVSETVLNTEFRVTLGRITQEQSLARIDADTGLPYDQGASRNRFITASIRRRFRGGMVQASFSEADARELSLGSPLPEAPRQIVDIFGTLERLPFHLQARAEYSQVGRKPLGDGFESVPVKEFRGALVRPFPRQRMEAGVHFFVARGFGGQTTEVLALPGEGEPFERIVGVRMPSYVSASLTVRLGR